MEPKTQSGKKWLVPALLVVIIALLAAVLFMRSCQAEPAKTDAPEDSTPKIGYAQGVTAVEDPDALQKAVDEMYAEAAKGGITLEYKNDASSDDGENFTCYIANAVENKYDMYIQIFADIDLTDHITLDHALDPGTHEVYVAFTQVEEDLETIHSQVVVTMNFSVSA